MSAPANLLTSAVQEDVSKYALLVMYVILIRRTHMLDKLPTLVGVCTLFAVSASLPFFSLFVSYSYCYDRLAFVFFLCLRFILFSLLFARHVERNTKYRT
jgi:hypothetical protein